MKIKNGVSLNSLEEILADYADLPVAQSDVTGLVSALAGKANAPIAQSDVTGLVSALSGKVSNTDFQAFLDVLDAQPSVINAISYKATTIPTGTATDGELCLCDDGKIYEHTGGAWDAGEALSVGERYWHFLTGSDVSGDSGSHTPGPNFYIYEWDGEAFSTYQVTFGTFACVEDLAKFYWYNGSAVVEFSSTQLSANELLAIQNANLQGTDTVAKVSDIPAQQLTSDELTAIQAASLTASDTVAKVSDIPAPQLTSDEVTAINNASLGASDTVAKVSDIPAPQLSAGELTAIQNASLVNTDTVAKTSDIPAPQLTSDELTAVQNASLISTDTVAKVSDIPAPQLTSNEVTAINNASLAGTDTVAKTSDIPAPQLTSNEVTAINNASLGASDTVAKVSDIYYQPNIEVPLSRMRVSEYVWTYTTNSLYLENASYYPSNRRDGLEFFYDIQCTSGIYELNAICPTNGDLGKVNVYIDDVYQGYIDTYTASLYYNVSLSVFLNITSNGAHVIKFVVTKNTSSSDYKVYFAKMVLRKIHVGWVFYWSHGKYSNHKVMNSTIIAGALQRNPEASMKPFQEYWLQNSPAINDEFHSPDMYLPDGTYELGMTILKNTNEGILSIYENDTLIDTYDFYAAAPEFNVIPTFSVTIDEARATKFKFKVLSKNASSSNYYIPISNLYLKKTA